MVGAPARQLVIGEYGERLDLPISGNMKQFAKLLAKNIN